MDSIPATAASETASSPKRRCVLIADDEAVVRDALRRFFTRRGWDCVEVADGLQARALLERDTPGVRFDLLICDLRMPRFSGFELYAWMAQCCPGALDRVVLSSGDTTTTETGEFLVTTGCHVLAKPFELPTLQALIDAAAGRTRVA